ncbi:disulfide bond formation protein B [Halapricum desulfuricans]|uniref:Disulfide bond formation protein DsbB n=1 Tax=Halapricum desulfuricans TaxID=2841257 RepID=A0A897N5G9_9EURY|nr:disulfide bond formation protein B [Halapricum desulfuricans]QSG07508.1 Disulfide bond formation protein DsbB [Halapricum desulfuricans]QSG10524.1 Disulfide bond formation protein DsbB [Halapricum desulfuricans]
MVWRIDALDAPLEGVPVEDGQTLIVWCCALIAAVATAGSLFVSTVLAIEPCPLCWYQRIVTFPLVAVFGVAALERRVTVYRTALPLSIGGVLIGAYHSWLQFTASSTGTCALGGGCSTVQYRLEPIGATLPQLGLLSMSLITALLVVLWARSE